MLNILFLSSYELKVVVVWVFFTHLWFLLLLIKTYSGILKFRSQNVDCLLTVDLTPFETVVLVLFIEQLAASSTNCTSCWLVLI